MYSPNGTNEYGSKGGKLHYPLKLVSVEEGGESCKIMFLRGTMY